MPADTMPWRCRRRPPRGGRASRALYAAGALRRAAGGGGARGAAPGPAQPGARRRSAAGCKGPTLEAPDGKRALLGTDQLGRDVLSRMVFGTRVSLTIGFSAVAVGGAIGGALGLVAGFRGGWMDEIVMTLADAQLAFPFILLAIGIIAVLGPSFPNLIIVVGLSGWVTYARMLRSQVLSLRQRDFVSAILALGGSVPRVLVRHILPNVCSTFMVIATLELARAIVLEATLSFLGLGIQPPIELYRKGGYDWRRSCEKRITRPAGSRTRRMGCGALRICWLRPYRGLYARASPLASDGRAAPARRRGIARGS